MPIDHSIVKTCPVCNSANLSLFDIFRSPGSDARIFSCDQCSALINEDAYLSLDDRSGKEIQATDFYFSQDLKDAELQRRRIRENDGILDYLQTFDERPTKELRFLDFGAGIGYASLAAASRYQQAVACDWDLRSLGILLETLPDLKDKVFIAEDIAGLSFACDVLFMWHTLEHLPHPTAFWREWSKVLAANATIFLQVPLYRPQHVVNVHHVFYTERSLTAWAHQIGAEPVHFGYDVDNAFIAFIGRMKSTDHLLLQPR